MGADSDKRVVWVWGAGASRSLGGPLLSEMFTIESLHNALEAFPEVHSTLYDCLEVAKLYTRGVRGVRLSPRSLQFAHNRQHFSWEHAEDFLERLDHASRHQDSAILRQMARALEMDRPDREAMAALRDKAILLLVAECSHFLRDADPASERWTPYRDWAKSVGPRDVVINFNYDTVLERLEGPWYRVWLPGSDHSDYKASAVVYKPHGSVDWIRNHNTVTRSDRNAAIPIALTCAAADRVMAVPGTSKMERVRDLDGPLRDVWNRCESALRDADAIVFVGYRFPPTDAWARRQLLSAISENTRAPIMHTVLGHDVAHPDSRRLVALLQTTGHADVRSHPMFAEDFIGRFERETLFKRP